MVFGFVKDGDGVSSQNLSQRRKGENKKIRKNLTFSKLKGRRD